jgi:aspartyl-tRNA(Asn)/glutamyl-tRNA(Gln) amidotransferase subunit C
MIDKKTVREVAALARLDLTEAEVDHMAIDLGKITAHIDTLASAGMMGLANAMDAAHDDVTVTQLRRDVARPGMRQEAFLANAPEQEAGYVRLPKVVE